MPFFQRAVYTPADQAFGNFFNLIDGFDHYVREPTAVPAAKQPKAPSTNSNNSKVTKHRRNSASNNHCTTSPVTTPMHPVNALANLMGLPTEGLTANTSGLLGRPFHPRFDVRETDDAYELHGELAGVDRKDVSIEFTEPQTLVVSGRLERKYTSSPQTPSADAVPEAVTDKAGDDGVSSDGARTPVHGDDDGFTQVSHHSQHAATVSDVEGEDEDVEMTPAVDSQTAAETKAVSKKAASTVTKAPTERYWVQERAVGEFQRTFNFAVPVDEEHVRASLDNGILTIAVPKAVKRQTRRIAVL